MKKNYSKHACAITLMIAVFLCLLVQVVAQVLAGYSIEANVLASKAITTGISSNEKIGNTSSAYGEAAVRAGAPFTRLVFSGMGFMLCGGATMMLFVVIWITTFSGNRRRGGLLSTITRGPTIE